MAELVERSVAITAGMVVTRVVNLDRLEKAATNAQT